MSARTTYCTSTSIHNNVGITAASFDPGLTHQPLFRGLVSTELPFKLSVVCPSTKL